MLQRLRGSGSLLDSETLNSRRWLADLPLEPEVVFAVFFIISFFTPVLIISYLRHLISIIRRIVFLPVRFEIIEPIFALQQP